MKRQIIKIDPDKCVGCGLCVNACHEGAIAMVEGKARLMHDDYCDGLGNCLPVCPTGAISFEEREAAPFNETRAKQHQQKEEQATQLKQWPVQIKLLPINAPFFDGANLLIAADCGAYAYANFHEHFMKNRITLIGCPKLDEGEYSEKLTAILERNNIESVTVVRMEVPCCGGIERAVKIALQNCGKRIPSQVIVLTVDGQVKE